MAKEMSPSEKQIRDFLVTAQTRSGAKCTIQSIEKDPFGNVVAINGIVETSEEKTEPMVWNQAGNVVGKDAMLYDLVQVETV